MPEAPIHEDGNALSAEDEVWLARKCAVSSPSRDPSTAQQLYKSHFCAEIAARPNAGHVEATLAWGEPVCHYRLSLPLSQVAELDGQPFQRMQLVVNRGPAKLLH